MRIKLSKQNWRLVGQKMGWLKSAGMAPTGSGGQTSFTAEQFLAQSSEEKISTALNSTIVEATQRLFFTEEYAEKGGVLPSLAGNKSITPEVQSLFFTEWYADAEKLEALRALAQNRNIHPETQRLFLTEEYQHKDHILKFLDKAR